MGERAKSYTKKEFLKILKDNGYKEDRHHGSHIIYKNGGDTIIIPHSYNKMLLRREVKEHNLKEIETMNTELSRNDIENLQAGERLRYRGKTILDAGYLVTVLKVYPKFILVSCKVDQKSIKTTDPVYDKANEYTWSINKVDIGTEEHLYR